MEISKVARKEQDPLALLPYLCRSGRLSVVVLVCVREQRRSGCVFKRAARASLPVVDAGDVHFVAVCVGESDHFEVGVDFGDLPKEGQAWRHPNIAQTLRHTTAMNGEASCQ